MSTAGGRLALTTALVCLGLSGCGSEPLQPGPQTIKVQEQDTIAASEVSGDAGSAACKSSKDCAASGQVCDRSRLPAGRCVDCVANADCLSAGQRCLQNVCVAETACQSDKQCPASAVCNKAEGVCVACNADTDCAKGQVCVDTQCLPKPPPCSSAADCEAAGLKCDLGSGTCVACTGDAHCQADAFCAQGQCVADVCVAGTGSCSGPFKLARCADNGGGVVHTTCAPGKGCLAGSCQPQVCVPGQKLCQDGAVQLCGPSGVDMSTVQTCAAGAECVQGTCVSKGCEAGQSKCGQSAILTCKSDGSGWSVLPCAGGNAQVCALVAGTPVCVTPLCGPGKAYCKDTVAHQCSADGLTSTPVEDCAVVASGATPKVCVDGACKQLECKPGLSLCSDNQTLATCKDDGSGFVKQPCAWGCTDGVCKQNACQADTVFCQGTTLMLCNKQGTSAVAGMDCATEGKVCLQGACVVKTNLCTPGVKSCQDGLLAVCSEDGQAWQSSACPAKTVCKGGVCVAQFCAPGALSCLGDLVTKCDAEGKKFEPVLDCEASAKKCDLGQCTGAWATAVATGGAHSCARHPGGAVSCWGDNTWGQVGSGQSGGMVAVPAKVAGLKSVLALGLGQSHGCAVDTEAAVQCWGAGSSGQLGVGGTVPSNVPVVLPGLKATSISAGAAFSCAVRTDGKLACWGVNGQGELGSGVAGGGALQTTPQLVAKLEGAVAVAALAHGACALLGDGSIWCWGANEAGILGTGSALKVVLPPEKVALSGKAEALWPGREHMCVTRSDKTGWCWGGNGGAQVVWQVGLAVVTSPLKLQLADLIAIAAGQQHTCGVHGSGAMTCWGAGKLGQIGDGKLAEAQGPTPVSGMTGVLSAASHADHTCALRKDGSVWCWGSNAHGQLGDGTTVNAAKPVLVKGSF